MGKVNADKLIMAERISPIAYTLITNKLATLKELRDDYDVWEALDLYEICMVHTYNQQTILQGGR